MHIVTAHIWFVQNQLPAKNSDVYMFFVKNSCCAAVHSKFETKKKSAKN